MFGEEWEGRGGGVSGRHGIEVSRRVAATRHRPGLSLGRPAHLWFLFLALGARVGPLGRCGATATGARKSAGGAAAQKSASPCWRVARHVRAAACAALHFTSPTGLQYHTYHYTLLPLHLPAHHASTRHT
eukprot:scaffold18116_cov123-Isochrysis_galbana.AAC.1